MKTPSFILQIFAFTATLLVSAVHAQIITDSGFETPAISTDSFSYNPSGGSWTFSQRAGLVNGNGGGFFSPAPIDGTQAAFIQFFDPEPTNGGQFSQSISLTSALTYRLSYHVAGRSDNGAGSGGNLNYEILLGSTTLGTDSTLTGQAYTQKFFDFTVPSSGSYNLLFRGLSGTLTTDNTAFFDSVEMTVVPEPQSFGLLLMGSALLWLVGSRRLRIRRP